MHDHIFRCCLQHRVVDNDTVVLLRQLGKLAVDNAVERVLIAPEDLRATDLLQPLKQLLCQFLLPPLSQIHQQHARIEIAAVFQSDTVTAAVFPIIARSCQYLALQVQLPQRQYIALADDVGIHVDKPRYRFRQHIGKQIAVIHGLRNMPRRYYEGHAFGTCDLVKAQCQIAVQPFHLL